MSLPIGATIGPYEIVALIGAGGMGEVYRAHDTRLGRDVALKVLPSAFSSDPDRVRRFEQEGRATAALNHPNIVALYDAGTYDGSYYVASELLEGGTLRERLSGAALPARKAIEYGVQIARGLAAAHAKGIIHRDLKPENLFVTKDGLVKILDFGLAKFQAPKSPAASPTDLATQPIETDPGKVLGTAGYMSPEQVRGYIADARSDLFSLGVVLYEMVSGKRAFTGDSAVEVMNAILKQEPPELEGALPPSFDRIIRRCLEKKPGERFQSASDLAFALESISATSERKPQPVPPPRRPDLWPVALAAGVLVLLATGVIIGQRTARAPSPSFQRITYRRGWIDSGRFANGGRTVVYSASWDGNPFRVYSTQEESPEFRDLGITNGHVLAVSSGGEMALALSPNFNFIGGTLARVPVSGGAPREMAEEISQADWTSDGTRMAVVRAKAGLQQLEFPTGNVLYKSTGGIGSARISPRGDLIAFLDIPLATSGALSGVGSLATVDMQGHKKTLTGYWGGYISGLAWSADGDEILFAAAPFGLTGSLYAVNRSGRQRLVEHLQGYFTVLDVAPDGRVLLVRGVISNSLFYQGPRASDATDLYWHDFSEILDVSRDGRTLLFAEGGDSDRSGEDYVSYIRRTDGSAAVRLGRGYPLALSPDGKWAMVLGSTEAPSQLLLLPTGVGEARQVTHDGIHHQGAAWTPDGKQIVFVGSEPGHGIRYFVQSVDGGLPRAITPENVTFNPADPITISPDGRFVAVNNSGGRISLQPLDGGTPRVVPKLEDGSEPLRWCPDGRSLMVYHWGDFPARIVNVDVDTGKQTLWRELAPSSRSGLGDIREVRVGSDCQSYAYSAFYLPSELWVARGLR